MGGALAKLNWKQVAVIGAVVCAIIGASLYFMLITKKQEEIARLRSELQSVQQTAGQLESARSDLARAIVEREAAQRRLAVYERTKMIPLSLTSEVDRYNTLMRLWREHAEVLGPLMERHIASTGVRLVRGAAPNFANLAPGPGLRLSPGTPIIPIPSPPATPGAISPGWYQISLGTITVQTDEGFPHVQRFLRSFTRAPRLVTVGPPSISGQSPNLTVSVPLVVYYMVRGGAAPAAAAPAAGMGMDMGVPPGMDPGMGPPPDMGGGAMLDHAPG